MQIRVPESEDLINLDLVVSVEPNKDELIIYFKSPSNKIFAWIFETKERFNEVLEQIQSFYKEL